MGTSRGYQHGPQRWARAAANSTDPRDGREPRLSAQTPETRRRCKGCCCRHQEACVRAQVTLHTAPPRSLCSSPLPGSRDPVTTLPGERTHGAPQVAATSRWPLPPQARPASSVPLPPPAWVSQSPRISCSFNPVLSGRATDALRWPTCRGGSKSKAEPRELYEQRREREISPSSLRSSGLKPHKQLDVPASVEYLNKQRIIPNSKGGLWEQDILIFPFPFFCECICVCFWVRFCLYSFAFTVSPRVRSVRFILFYFIFLLKSFFP